MAGRNSPRPLPSGSLTVAASGGSGEQTVELSPGDFCGRWSGRLLDEASAWSYAEADETDDPPDDYRLQLWPAIGEVLIRELKRSRQYDH
jgi:hypothetical protein